MPAFIVRVELIATAGRHPQWSDYLTLHTAMEARDFSRVVGVGKQLLQLPNAEYVWTGDATAEHLVTRSADFAAHNLTPL